MPENVAEEGVSDTWNHHYQPRVWEWRSQRNPDPDSARVRLPVEFAVIQPMSPAMYYCNLSLKTQPHTSEVSLAFEDDQVSVPPDLENDIFENEFNSRTSQYRFRKLNHLFLSLTAKLYRTLHSIRSITPPTLFRQLLMCFMTGKPQALVCPPPLPVPHLAHWLERN